MRTPIIAGNWKMHMTVPEARELVQGMLSGIRDREKVEVVLGPPYTALSAVADLIRGTGIGLAGQNVHWEEKGAFTGEISAAMLKDAGCTHAIVGHSERRQYFCETDETVNRRTRAAQAAGLQVILCIGETLEEREKGMAFDVLARQLGGALNGLSMEGLAIAYEPVWAIGTGKKATDGQANEAHAFIRSWISKNYDAAAADAVRILYGGSVKPENVDGLMAQPEVDGALVGGASLKPESFARLVNFRPPGS